MASDPNDQLQRAIALIQAGRPDEARPLLKAVVAADPTQELGWLWLATVSTDRAERIGFLERVLALNPANETARTAYARLTGEPFPASALPPSLPPAPPHDESSRRGITPGTLLILMAIIAVAVAAVLIALYLRDSDNETGNATVAATMFPVDSPTPTSRFSPTPSHTPLPTVTPGPSPTLVWDSALPTWTAAPSLTPVPVREVVTWTPRPLSATPTEPEPTPSETPQDTPTRVSPALTAVATEALGDRVTRATGGN